MDFQKIKAQEIRKGDTLLTVDHGGNEELCEAMCVDGNNVWTKGFVNQDEIKETVDEMNHEYDSIYRLR